MFKGVKNVGTTSMAANNRAAVSEARPTTTATETETRPSRQATGRSSQKNRKKAGDDTGTAGIGT
jgi:hypothetical protein